ncbi:MAG: hypothetical protein ACMUIU_14805 [bacterium]
MYNVIFVDDREDEFKILSHVEREAGDTLKFFKYIPEASIGETQKKISKMFPELLLLDYRLDEKPVEDNKIAEYKAGPVAQQFRDLAIDNYKNDLPIFAVSVEDNIRNLYEPDKTAHDLFDQILPKTFFIDHPKEAIKQMISFIEAYKKIIDCFNIEKRLDKLLQINEEEVGFIDSHFFSKINKLKAPHLVSIKIFKTFIERSWLLLDIDNLISLLGVHPDEKGLEQFKELIKIMAYDTEYCGIFGKGFKRWWANRVKQFFEKRCSSQLGNLTAVERIEKISDCIGLKFKPAVSRWAQNSNTYVSFACSSCRNPTEVEYSVSAYDPVSHPIIGKNRICWRCIQTGEYESKGLLVDDSDEFIANKIKNGKIVFS